MKDVLVAEISGKRPGNSDARPTEKFKVDYDKLIISNNSDNYETDWLLINVPKEYEEWYKSNIKSSDNAWYAPMNRSYAIKYAKEHGYKYLIQLDDNIVGLKIAYSHEENNFLYNLKKEYTSKTFSGNAQNDILNDYIDMLVTVLENTNAGMAGCNMYGASKPGSSFLCERYCYSLFALKLDSIPSYFQGDFEDDIEFRLKLKQMNIPCVQIAPLMYGKTSQGINKDLSGCRQEYARVGVRRGEHMRKLYGDVYSAGTSWHSNGVGKQKKGENEYFRHKLKPIKLGVIINDKGEKR